MSSAMHNAVYNSRIPGMPTPLSPRSTRSLLLLPAVLLAAMANAQNWIGAEELLAGKIVSAADQKTMAVEVSNRSSLRSATADDIRRGLLTRLAALGARFVNAEQAAASVHVSLSEDLRSYVWVAEIRQGGNEPSVVMVSLPRPDTPSVEPEAAMVLRKIALWSQQERVLDLTIIEGNPSRMAVLDSNGVELYRLQDSRWQPEQSLPVSHSHPWPRDLRGRLILRKDHLFDVYLPGVFCRSMAGAPPSMTCYDSDDAWPIGTDLFSLNASFASSRNFFSGALSPGVGQLTTAPAFYSAAALPRDKNAMWLLATVDGQVHMLDGITDQAAGKLGWGSDIAAVRSGCGSGWQVLAAGIGEGPSDVVRAFEVPDRAPVASSPPLEIQGSVTALWTESGGAGAIAVVRNSETGRYEASRLTLACGR